MRVFSAIVLCALGATAHGAGFDCTQASLPTERMICAQPLLSSLDNSLNLLYASRRQHYPDSEALGRSQREWLEQRNRCDSSACLERRYTDRLSQLAAWGAANHIDADDLQALFGDEVGTIERADILYQRQDESSGSVVLLAVLHGFEHGSCRPRGACGCGEANYLGYLRLDQGTHTVKKREVKKFYSSCQLLVAGLENYFIMETWTHVIVGATDEGATIGPLVPLIQFDKQNDGAGLTLLSPPSTAQGH